MSNKNSVFHKYNGFLRLSSVVLGLIAVGLTLSKFRKTELHELIYLATLGFCSVISLLHFCIIFLTPCSPSGKCFKIVDFIFHFCGGILLLVSSVLMLQVATKKGKILDYRFQDTKVVLVRATAGIFGLQNSLLYFILAYLTITQKQLVYCQRLPKKKKTDAEAVNNNGNNPPGSQPVTTPSLNANDGDAPSIDLTAAAKVNKTPIRFFVDRFTWRRLVVDEILEARVLTLIFGITNVVLLADSYQAHYEVEEYFFSMVIICCCLTVLSQAFYAFGIVNLEESTCTLVDIIIQFISSANLLAGGTVMLGSVIENNSYGYQHKSIERTAAALLGIFNGLLYSYIGTNVKRSYFTSRLGSSVTCFESLPPSSSRNKESTPNVENVLEDPKSGCAMT
ncbi:unnamed protein product [Allacma fusca]|uniref:Uncharacterized protein n=1 Tax=Allacma fusca TaxID=39272 RepID=A0A8J2KI72_9HEXA|nr:unnamed protein product [Allacma fusca]